LLGADLGVEPALGDDPAQDLRREPGIAGALVPEFAVTRQTP
jgi:hypothetical protein